MSKEQPKNGLHGITLKTIIETLVLHLGFEEMHRLTDIRTFKSNPSVNSSLKFLRKTPWARERIEELYLEVMGMLDEKKEKNRKRNLRRKARRAYAEKCKEEGTAEELKASE